MIVLSARLKRDPFHGRASFEVADPVVVPESRVVLTEAISETIFRLRWSAWRVSVIVQCLAAASQRQSLCNGQFSLAFDGSLFVWQSRHLFGQPPPHCTLLVTAHCSCFIHAHPEHRCQIIHAPFRVFNKQRICGGVR